MNSKENNNNSEIENEINNKPKQNLKLSLNFNKTIFNQSKKIQSRNNRGSSLLISPIKIRSIQQHRTSVFAPKIDNYYMSTEEDMELEEEEKNNKIKLIRKSLDGINPRKNIIKYLEEKKELKEKEIKDNLRRQEIENLLKERHRLKQTLIFSNTPQTMSILSIKIMRINNKINKLLKLISGEISEKKEKNDKIEENNLKRNAISDRNIKDDLKDINFSNMKEDLRLIDNFLKIQDINYLCKIIDINTVIEAIKDQPNFIFQRNENNNIYKTSTEYSSTNRKVSTLLKTSFHPSGFTHNKKEKNKYNKSLPLTFEDIIYEIEEKDKNNNNNNHKTIKTDLFSNNNSTNYNTISFETKSESNNFFRLSNVRNKTAKNNKKRLKIGNFKEKKTSLNEKVIRTLNDGNIIKNEIEEGIKLSNQTKKKDREKVLLKLANKINLKEQILKKIRNKKKPILIDEEYFIEQLSKIPNQVKEDFRNTFKKILAEDRLLNNKDKFKESYYEQKMRYIREQKYFKEESIRTMHLLKDNKVSDKDDDEVLKEDKIFDNYGNLLSLEWQIKKKHILRKKNNPIGAYNPKQKRNLGINYPNNFN